MTAIKSHYSRLFEQLVVKLRAELLEGLAAGTAGDYAAYRQHVGRIKASTTR